MDDIGKVVNEIHRQLTARPESPYIGNERWERLIAAWRALYRSELETLWEFAAVATQVADEFGDEAISYFAREVRNPERMMRRAIESFRDRHIQPEAPSELVFRNESEFADHIQRRFIARGFFAKREAGREFGRVDIWAGVYERGAPRARQIVEVKLSSDWRAAAQALGQLLFYKGVLDIKFEGMPATGLWFASPARPDDDVLAVLARYGVRYFE